MTHTNGVVRMVEERKPGIIAAALSIGHRRATDTAQQMSARGAMRAAAEFCNEAICKLINLAYETDETGLCNIDASGVLEKKAAPWGRFYGRYGLQANERDVLKLHISRLAELHRPVPLFLYDPASRRWGVNVDDYPDRAAALRYWSLVELDARTYKHLLEQVRRKREGK